MQAGGQGTLDGSRLAWKSAEREITSDVSTPLFYQNRFYVLNSDRKSISRVVPDSGKIEWTGEPGSPAKIESSPTAADGRASGIPGPKERKEVEAAQSGNQPVLPQSPRLGPPVAALGPHPSAE